MTDAAAASAGLRRAGAAAVADVLRGVGVLPGIRPLWRPVSVAAPVHTCAGDPRDNLPLHRASSEAPPGSVIVAALGGDTSVAVFGDVLGRIAHGRGVAGLVVDGAVRDADGLQRLGFATFSAGESPLGPGKDCWGTAGEPVTVAGVAVAPGDWVVGDGDGVVVVPAARLDEVVAAAAALVAREEELVGRALAGEPTVDQLGLRPRLG